MPMLASVQTPLYSRSPSSSASNSEGSKDKGSGRPANGSRTYEDGPLPVVPSEDALADARIVGRVVSGYGAFYALKIGDVEINNVGLNEVLDYVSAQHLEEYENQQFEEEAQLVRIAQVEEERLELERQERRKERTKMKGIAGYYDESSGADLVAAGGENIDDASGEHGRARPTYKHMFKQPKELKVRRRRKRDPVTGELLPLSDDDEDGAALQSSDEDLLFRPDAIQSEQDLAPPADQPKRRRRKRDPVTGELLPLASQSAATGVDAADWKKRPRRKRHPVTGELMPLGWRYDSTAAGARSATSKSGQNLGHMSPAMHRLSLSQEHTAKRLKLDSQSSSGASASARVVLPSPAKVRPVDEKDDESSSEDDTPPPSVMMSAKTTPKHPGASRGQLGMPAVLQSTATSSAAETSPEPVRTTSILRPTATTSTAESEDDDESDDMGEGEWVIEAILAHHMSDPKTHPSELGNKPVMLYQVKWEGFDDLTWEPIDSFPDRSVVEDYQRHIMQQASTGKASAVGRPGSIARTIPSQQSPASNLLKRAAPRPETPERSRNPTTESESDDDDENDEEDEDGTYVVEAILGHQLSDPRTHDSEYGTKPVVLYKVKWKGFQNPTWEPAASFEGDTRPLQAYKARAGLGM